MKIFIIGHTGQIGKAIFDYSISAGIESVGINSKNIKFYSGTEIVEKFRESPSLFSEMQKYLDNESIIINCSWKNLSAYGKDSEMQLENASIEVELLKPLCKVNFFQYISFGSILETQRFSMFKSESNYVKAKNEIHNFLRNNFENYSWVRLATPYSRFDPGNRIIHKMLINSMSQIDTPLDKPNKFLNIYRLEDFINLFMLKIFDPLKKEVNVGSEVWATLSDIKNSIYNFKDLNYEKKVDIPFGLNDKNLFLVKSPPFLEFIKEFNLENI
jgi:hypothetical protein